MKLTLDTNCIINVFDHGSKTATSVESLERLFRAALSGQGEVAITTRVREDLENDTNEPRKVALLRTCKLFPIIGSVFRFDVSRWEGGDYWASEEDTVMIADLQKALFPCLSPDQSDFRNKLHDIDHLFAHAKAHREIFVTDDKEILKKRTALKREFAIVVRSPDEAVTSL